MPSHSNDLITDFVINFVQQRPKMSQKCRDVPLINKRNSMLPSCQDKIFTEGALRNLQFTLRNCLCLNLVASVVVVCYLPMQFVINYIPWPEVQLCLQKWLAAYQLMLSYSVSEIVTLMQYHFHVLVCSRIGKICECIVTKIFRIGSL